MLQAGVPVPQECLCPSELWETSSSIPTHPPPPTLKHRALGQVPLDKFFNTAKAYFLKSYDKSVPLLNIP